MATLAPLREAFPGDDDLARLEECIADRRQEACRRLALALGSPRYTSAVLTLGQWIVRARLVCREIRSLMTRQKAHVSGALSHVYAQVLSHGEGFDALNAVTRHQTPPAHQAPALCHPVCRPGLPGHGALAPGALCSAGCAGRGQRCGRGQRPDQVLYQVGLPASAPLPVPGASLPAGGRHGANTSRSDARARWRAFTELEPFWKTAPDRP